MIKSYDTKNNSENLLLVSSKLAKEITSLKGEIKSSQEKVSRARKLIEELREEKEKAALEKSEVSDLFKSSEKVQVLSKQKEMLEDKIVQFKLLVANIKGEIEGMDDLKRRYQISLNKKNSEIQKLTLKAGELKGEKHRFILQCAKNSVRHQKKKSGLKSFFKGHIKQYPSSSFQFALSFDNGENPVQSLHTSFIDRTIPTLYTNTGTSSTYSEV